MTKKTDEPRPEGWTFLEAVHPGQCVTYRLKDWRQAQEFMEFNGAVLWRTHTYAALGEDPTVLRERSWLRRGTWFHTLLERRQDRVTVAVDARWRKAFHLGTKPGMDPVFESRAEWSGG